MNTRAGLKRERIVIETASSSVDSEGQPIRTWSTLATVWAHVEFPSGREGEGMNKVYSQTAATFTVNYRTDVTAIDTTRIVWRSENWNIGAVLPSANKFDMTLLASKVE